VTTETLLESPTTVALQKKLAVVRCPKCGSVRAVTKRAERKFEVFECGSCGYAWKEMRVVKPPSKIIVCCLWVQWSQPILWVWS
jgi:predicted RNA-binding Zn-ribbon protein involved in translation (DUF1610 family)